MRKIRKIIVFFIVPLIWIISGGCKCNVGTYYGTGYYAPAWSPDGTRIYYFRNDLTVNKVQECPMCAAYYEYKKNEWYICSSDTNGENRKEIYKVGEFEGKGRIVDGMDISPNGEIIYSTSYYTGEVNVMLVQIKRGIWIVDTTGSNDHQVLPWGRNPRWAYNYTKIIFEGDSGHSGIWLMDKDGTNVSVFLVSEVYKFTTHFAYNYA